MSDETSKRLPVAILPLGWLRPGPHQDRRRPAPPRRARPEAVVGAGLSDLRPGVRFAHAATARRRRRRQHPRARIIDATRWVCTVLKDRACSSGATACRWPRSTDQRRGRACSPPPQGAGLRRQRPTRAQISMGDLAETEAVRARAQNGDGVVPAELAGDPRLAGDDHPYRRNLRRRRGPQTAKPGVDQARATVSSPRRRRSPTGTPGPKADAATTVLPLGNATGAAPRSSGRARKVEDYFTAAASPPSTSAPPPRSTRPTPRMSSSRCSRSMPPRPRSPRCRSRSSARAAPAAAGAQAESGLGGAHRRAARPGRHPHPRCARSPDPGRMAGPGRALRRPSRLGGGDAGQPVAVLPVADVRGCSPTAPAPAHRLIDEDLAAGPRPARSTRSSAWCATP